MKTYSSSSDPDIGEEMGEKMGSATTTGRSTLHTGAAKIVGGHRGDGPGPQVMSADTLQVIRSSIVKAKRSVRSRTS